MCFFLQAKLSEDRSSPLTVCVYPYYEVVSKLAGLSQGIGMAKVGNVKAAEALHRGKYILKPASGLHINCQ